MCVFYWIWGSQLYILNIWHNHWTEVGLGYVAVLIYLVSAKCDASAVINKHWSECCYSLGVWWWQLCIGMYCDQLWVCFDGVVGVDHLQMYMFEKQWNVLLMMSSFCIKVPAWGPLCWFNNRHFQFPLHLISENTQQQFMLIPTASTWLNTHTHTFIETK